MENSFITIVVITIIIVIILYMLGADKENLSLSQFPQPIKSTSNFYTCGRCATYFQPQNNNTQQPCACSSIISYKTPQNPSCYKQTLQISQPTCSCMN